MDEEMLMRCMTQMHFTDMRAWKIISSYLQHLAAQCSMYVLKKVIQTFWLPVTKNGTKIQRMRDDAMLIKKHKKHMVL